ncbi:hypothetical protein R3W88_000460 [Solanum pinnatisectum]|uniref:RNase III domain-containing protein n=1 Tax=Solanum pinnatisectum TaxID=50273 RepID=A0AAV9MFM5_9SOLN|nr:hypothetical protein R3W88_000460 [Solanum pinnatisectum]
MLLNHRKLKHCIPTAKILEVMTTKKCLQKFHLESLGKLGDSFLKYAIMGKVAALSFMKWIGMDIDFIDAPMLRHFIVNYAEKLVNFHDPSLPVKALTHGSYILIPRLITYLRSTFVNNECYAQSAVKASMHKHILHASPDLQRQICCTVEDFEKLDLVSTFGWESETTFPNSLQVSQVIPNETSGGISFLIKLRSLREYKKDLERLGKI